MQNRDTPSEDNPKSNLRSRMGRPARSRSPAPNNPSVIGEVNPQAMGPISAAKPKAPQAEKKVSPAPKSEDASAEAPSRGPREASARNEEGAPARPSRRRRSRRPSESRQEGESPARSGGRGSAERMRVEEKPAAALKNEVYYEPPRRKKNLSEDASTASAEPKSWVKSFLGSVFGFGCCKKPVSAEPKPAPNKDVRHARGPAPQASEGSRPSKPRFMDDNAGAAPRSSGSRRRGPRRPRPEGGPRP